MRKKSCETALRRIPEDATDEELGIYANSPIPKHSTKEEFELFRDTGMTCLVDDTSEEAMNRRAAFFLNVMLWTKEKCGEAAGKRLLEIRKNQIQSVTTARAGKLMKKAERDDNVLDAAFAILEPLRGKINWTDLSVKVGAWLQDPPVEWMNADETHRAWGKGISRSSVCERLERVKDRLPMEKIGPWKKGSGD